MLVWQQILIIIFLLYSLVGLGFSIWQIYKQNNFFGLCPLLLPFGAFVWIDGVILCAFWIVFLGITLVVSSWKFFFLVYGVFWMVRSLGEIIYWIHEQFAVHHRNLPHTLGLAYKLFPNESVWIVMQLFWQIVLIVSILGLLVILRNNP